MSLVGGDQSLWKDCLFLHRESQRELEDRSHEVLDLDATIKERQEELQKRAQQVEPNAHTRTHTHACAHTSTSRPIKAHAHFMHALPCVHLCVYILCPPKCLDEDPSCFNLLLEHSRTQLLVKWLLVIKDPKYKMSLQSLWWSQICFWYKNNCFFWIFFSLSSMGKFVWRNKCVACCISIMYGWI